MTEKPKGSFPSLRQILDELAQVKTKLFLMNLFTRLRGK